MGGKTEFIELAACKTSENRNVVISEVKGQTGRPFTLAQQIVVHEGGKETTIYLKGAIHIESLEHLENLKAAVDLAIEKAKKV